MVVAPVPWFPFEHKAFGRYASFARVPREEQRHGLTVLHPRYPLMPKVGMSSAPFLMYAALRTLVCGDPEGALPLRPDRRALFLSGRRRGGLAWSKSRQAGSDHGAWHGRESDPRVPGSAADGSLGRSAGGRRGRGIRGAARTADRAGRAGQPRASSSQRRGSGAVRAAGPGGCAPGTGPGRRRPDRAFGRVADPAQRPRSRHPRGRGNARSHAPDRGRGSESKPP